MINQHNSLSRVIRKVSKFTENSVLFCRRNLACHQTYDRDSEKRTFVRWVFWNRCLARGTDVHQPTVWNKGKRSFERFDERFEVEEYQALGVCGRNPAEHRRNSSVQERSVPCGNQSTSSDSPSRFQLLQTLPRQEERYFQ